MPTLTAGLLGLEVSPKGYALERSVIHGRRLEFAKIMTGRSRPDEMRINVSAPEAGDDVLSFMIVGPERRMMALDNEFVVPVEWRENRQRIMVPRTRETDVDNIDVMLVNRDGSFRDVQVWLVSRGQDLYALTQEVFSGWATTRGFIAGTPEDNYPEADYGRSWHHKEAQVLREQMEETGIPLADPTAIVAPEWLPVYPEEDQRRWQKGTVLQFNAGFGVGKILGEDGRTYHVHFSTIQGQSVFRVLEEMAPVYFRPEEPESERGPAIKVCKAA